MFERETVLKNRVGLHARAAAFFVQRAGEFKSSILVQREERTANGKSLLGILALGVGTGTTIKIMADGKDEKIAVNSLINLIDSDFQEE